LTDFLHRGFIFSKLLADDDFHHKIRSDAIRLQIGIGKLRI